MDHVNFSQGSDPDPPPCLQKCLINLEKQLLMSSIYFPRIFSEGRGSGDFCTLSARFSFRRLDTDPFFHNGFLNVLTLNSKQKFLVNVLEEIDGIWFWWKVCVGSEPGLFFSYDPDPKLFPMRDPRSGAIEKSNGSPALQFLSCVLRAKKDKRKKHEVSRCAMYPGDIYPRENVSPFTKKKYKLYLHTHVCTLIIVWYSFIYRIKIGKKT